MTAVTETIQLKGITCSRCVMRLRHVLKDHDGLVLILYGDTP